MPTTNPTRRLTPADYENASDWAVRAVADLARSNCPGEHDHEGKPGRATVRADFCDKCVENKIRDAWLAGRMES
jgi:hypothetical protein